VHLEVKYMDIVAMKRILRNRIKNSKTCVACWQYKHHNRQKGYCDLFRTDTCPEGSCGSYIYLHNKDNGKLI